MTGSDGKLLLQHSSSMGEFILSSDTIVHSLFYSDDTGQSFSNKISYSKRFPFETIKNEIPDVIKDFWKNEFGIACYMVFPAKQINRKFTINQARGVDTKICDRFDLTLECIRRYYQNSADVNPLHAVLKRYHDFFALFENFTGYTDFFHLQDLVEHSASGSLPKFWLPFDNFIRSPLPQSSQEYHQYKKNVCEFINKRKKRISGLSK
jgi:hypothetical protein